MQRPHCEAPADQRASVPTAILHHRFEREAIPLLGLLQRGATRRNNRQDAEDLLKDTMLLAYAGFAPFREGANLTAWMFRIMQNAWISSYRKRHRRTPEVLTDYFTESTMANERVRQGQRPAEIAALEQIPDERVLDALMALSEKFRMAVYYADVEGFRYKDIARLTATPVGTVTSRVHRGRQLLRKSLADPSDDRSTIAATGTRR